MQRIEALECLRCGSRYAVDGSQTGCAACASIAPANLRLRYSDRQKATWNFRDKPGAGLWRYADMLPVEADKAVSLSEGATPLIHAPRFGKGLGLERLYIKDESRNPTWSYKDRLSTVAVSFAKERGVRVLATASSGNAGASLAAYAAKAGLACVVVTMAGTAGPMLSQIRKYGAEVVTLTRKADRWPVIAQGARKHGWFATSPHTAPVIGSTPFGIEGYKTIAYELIEDLNGRCPDWIALPVCYGDALSGMWQGFCEMREAGFIDRLPRLLAAEVHGSLSQALETGSDAIPEMEARFASRAISVGTTQSSYQAVRALRESRGLAVAIDNEMLVPVQQRLAAKEGLLAELTAVLPFIAIERLRRDNVINPDDLVVSLMTSGGLKDLDLSSDALPPLPAEAGSVDQVLAGIQERLRNRDKSC